jgi:hypothetical protein
MESQGIPGAIQVTERAYLRLAPAFAFHERGTIDVKGKGPMRTYLLVASRKATATETGTVQEHMQGEPTRANLPSP